MRTFEDLIKEVESNDAALTKEASEKDNTLELLQGLSEKMEKNASQERIMKHAQAAGSEFAKSAALKFAEAAQEFVNVVSTDEFAEKVANLILEKLAVDTSDKTIHSDSEPTPKEDPRTAVEKDQKQQNLAQPHKVEKAKQDKIDAEVVEGASATGSGDLLSEKKAALDALMELLQDEY